MSLAIQYRMKKGGMLTDDGYQSTCDEHCNYPCDVHMSDAEGYAEGGPVEMGKKGGEPHVLHETKRMHGGFPDRMGPTGHTGYSNRNKSSDLGGGQRKGPEGYPKYQEQAQNQKGVHTPVSGVTGFPGGKGTSEAGKLTKERYGGKPLFSGKGHPAIKEHKRVLKEMRRDKGDRSNLACGGVVDRVMAKRMARGGSIEDAREKQIGVNHPMHSGTGKAGTSNAGMRVRRGNQYGKDMASSKAVAYSDAKHLHRDTLDEIRSMKGPHGNYSEGGKVANTDELTAGFEPNEFDDLHLRDDLESEYTGENSGDELGNEGEDERRRDIVSRIMRSRAKRAGHNPRPA